MLKSLCSFPDFKFKRFKFTIKLQCVNMLTFRDIPIKFTAKLMIVEQKINKLMHTV